MHRGRPLVLVVADDSATRCNFVTWLANVGYRCVTTDNVTTALWYVRRLAPAITAVDVDGRRERVQLARFLASTPAPTNLVTRLEPAAFTFALTTNGRMEPRCS